MIDVTEMTVLIVDDMPSMHKFIHKMMRNIGYGNNFLFASNGREALNILKHESVDILLLDYNMPEMTGGELLSIIRADRDLRDLLVVMITAEQGMDYVAEIGESEIDAYIIKPVTMKLLEEKIAAAVEVANNPPPMTYHLKRARDFEAEGDLDAAIEESLMAMNSNPNSTKPIRELGYYHYLKNDLEEAEKWLLQAAERNRLDVFAFHYLGEVYLKQNNIEKAALYFEKAMKISPRHIDRGINFGKTLIRMKMIPQAIQVFNRTLELAGKPSDMREEIAMFCIQEGVNAYAADILGSIIKEQPNRADLLFNLGKVLEKLDEFSKAVKFLTRASELDKANVDIRIHLAKDYITLKKPLLAEKPLKEILKKNPNNKLARELLKECV